MESTVRRAVEEDIPAMETLIAQSVRGLQAGDYTPDQMEGALGTVFGVDRQLIADGTYFAIEVASEIVACGGWSRRRTLFGSDRSPVKDDTWLNPLTEPAKIRAFFIHPDWARRGLASQILSACEAAAAELGFQRLELAATLTGRGFFRARGFAEEERIELTLSNGVKLPVIRMSKAIG